MKTGKNRHKDTNSTRDVRDFQTQNQITQNDCNNNIQNEYEEQPYRSVFNLNICSLNVQGLAKYEGDVNFQHYLNDMIS